MNRRYFERQEPRLNIIPMIDIMMFLLIFFVLAVLHMIPDTGVKLHLPSASTSTSLPKKSQVIAIESNGGLRYDQQQISLNALKTKLQQLPDKPDQVVIIASDKTVEVAELMHIMNTVRQTGITRIGIATKSGKS